jgi:hypothetical protein
LVVVSIKGTSAGLFTGGPTGEKDKINVSNQTADNNRRDILKTKGVIG